MTLPELIARDGPVCVWCGRQLWSRDLTAEHLLPRARGGRGIPENLAVACRRCNRSRRTRAIAAYVRALRDEGIEPRVDLLAAALTRLAHARSRPHAEYGARQNELLEGLGQPVSAAGAPGAV